MKSGRKSMVLNTEVLNHPPVSIIICARNEGDNLKKHLPFFLEQDYPDYELIVVNDGSDDDTAEILDNLKIKYSNLRVSTIRKDPKFLRGKKLAMTIGLKAAKNDIVLLSDADCSPAGNEWIKYMVRNFDEKRSIVIGVGLYEKRKSLLNLFIRFEAAFIAMQYISLTHAGRPYMGVGRNLSYQKEIFFKNKGFASHLKLESGDDDLFINEVANAGNSIIETHPSSFTYSVPETKWTNWIRQKRRHLTTAKMYKKSSKRILGLEYISRMILLGSFISLLISFEEKQIVLIAYGFLMLIKGITFYVAFNALHEKFLFLLSIILEPLTPWFYGLLHIFNFLERKKVRWN